MPTQTELEFRCARGGVTQNRLLCELFLDRPNTWIPMPEIARRIRAFAVHSRVSDLRRRFGMRIERKTGVDRLTRQRWSAYRYVPNE